MTELEDVPVRTIAGQVDTSRQAFDRSSPELDIVIASELGRAYAELLEEQLINGDGTGQQLTGLLAVSGTTSVTYVDAAPTVAEFWPKLMQAFSETSTAWKNTVPVALMHQRRAAWMHSSVGNAPVPPPGVRFVTAGSIPTDLGGGTEDAVITFDPSALRLHAAPPRFLVDINSGAANATVKMTAYGYVASIRHVSRQRSASSPVLDVPPQRSANRQGVAGLSAGSGPYRSRNCPSLAFLGFGRCGTPVDCRGSRHTFSQSQIC